MYRYGLIGNCNVSALAHESGSIDWLCFPRPDSPPVFGRILDPGGGHFSIDYCGDGRPIYSQRYRENTNILETEVQVPGGDGYRIIDFCPRFEQHGRMFRPLSVFRIIEPISGAPTVKVSCCPVEGWSKSPVPAVRGNSHLRFELGGDSLRLTTNMPLTYLSENKAFLLRGRVYTCLTWNSHIEEDLEQLSERFLLQTENYWKSWVKHCSIPSQFQRETIRSALALKLHCYEDTGAILAALTTSLPEETGRSRNWDYRYCWLRDSYFVLSAFHNLGHFEEMEGFLKFLLNVVHLQGEAKQKLAPVYSLSRELPLPEVIHGNWEGYKGSQPVRSFNQAAEHTQNDVYGEVILTLAPIFFDERFFHLRNKDHESLMGHMARLAADSIGMPDAGLWELRDGWQVHTFTNLMSWAGLERIGRIQDRGYLRNLGWNVTQERDRAASAVNQAIRDEILRNGPRDESLDAALALLPVFRFPDSNLSQKTIDQILKNLRLSDGSEAFFHRYVRSDDFGNPQSAFVVCSFWMAQSLAQLKRYSEARAILTTALRAANSLGLYSEHFLPERNEQLGNFPQAYSHVGLINAAFAVSPPWSEVL